MVDSHHVAVVSDIHLKLRKHTDFEAQRFKDLFTHLIAQEYETVVINGDLFDNGRATLEELSLAITELHKLSKVSELLILAGNHDMVTKDQSIFDYVRFPGTTIKEDTREYLGTTIQFIDWPSIERIKHYEADILISHFRCNVPPYIKEEVPVQEFKDRYKMAILGDIHNAEISPATNFFYTGSPYSTKFSSSIKTHGYRVVTITREGFSQDFVSLDLPRKIRWRLDAQAFAKAKFFSRHLYHCVVTGTPEELAELSAPANVQLEKLVELKAAKPVVPRKSNNFIRDMVDRLSDHLDLGDAGRGTAYDILKSEWEK